MRKYKNIMMPLSGGLKLATDVYLPDEGKSFPMIFNRTPYNKDYVEDSDEIKAYIDAGYGVVIQDTRGRYASEGDFNAHQDEIDDGTEFVNWLRKQDFCNGRIGSYGSSYHGGTQWFAAYNNPEGFECMVPCVTFDDMYDGCAYQGGAKVMHDLRWVCADIVKDSMNRARARGEEVTLEPPEVYGCLDRIPIASEESVEKYAKFYKNWLEHDTYDDYWKRTSHRQHYKDIMIPAMNISGWYDILTAPTFRNYMGMRDNGGCEKARKNNMLILGPWTHMNFSGKLNGFDFGPDASDKAIDLVGMKIAWFDHWLKDEPMRLDMTKPVRIFVMGDNKWREESDWPLPGTKFTPFYLSGEGNANKVNSSLSTEKPADEKADSFVFDPFNPVPTIGGGVILPGDNAMGPRDQREAEERDDVLIYETEALKEPVCIAGPVNAKLYVSSDCVDTDFTVKLTDVFPDGTSMLLCDGILRMRFRNSIEKPELMEPGVIYEADVMVQAVANTFLEGHRIRVSVSSSNFPRFNRNSNSGGKIAFEQPESYRKANNTIYHDAVHASAVILPIVDRK